MAASRVDIQQAMPLNPIMDRHQFPPQGHQPTVFNRLHGLLSPRQQSSGTSAMPRPGDTPTSSTRKALPIDPKFLKIRILTWNMHDSLPKGDLEELLGKVPVYNSPTGANEFPHLPNDGHHPYHLVVIAGQECPTPSGIPMGLGGIKILDKDRDRSKDSGKDHDKAGSKIKDRHDDSKFHRHEDDFEGPPIGWTSIVEDWLCNGTGYCRTNSPTTAEIGFPRPLIRQKSSKDSRKGPYQLLIKDRLMGIYLAIYIHRDLKPFVQGTSKSAVTAGLIGGRVGNKGGVGISLKIDGTTFLFMNAHLAAHEGKVHHRVANLAKIKSQLSVDDFLPEHDSRKSAEDLTDRFDFAFLCGDLNFRLNLSRLHADWLIERGEYAQAFEFDQLHLLMKDRVTFAGFHEALINFPPTFKYDVLRTVKRSKRSSSKRGRLDERFGHIAEIEERERETQDEDGDEDAVSITSTATGATSINSQLLVEPANEDFLYIPASPSVPTSRGNSSSKVSVASIGAHKAKIKLLSLLSPSFLNTSDKVLRVKSNPDRSMPSTPTTPAGFVPPTRRLSSNVSEISKKPRPPPMILVNSPDSPGQNSLTGDTMHIEKGVYDSSSKKRVPSWCDRILWKTTIVPAPPPDYEEHVHDSDLQRPRNRMGQFFANAFRPPSARADFAGHITPTSTPFSRDTTPTLSSSFYTPTTPQASTPSSSTSHRQSQSISIPCQPRTRPTNTARSPPPTAPLPLESQPTRRGTDNSEGSQSATHQSKWRGLLPSFLSPTHTQSAPQDHPPPTNMKGNVKCLSYNTLDDRGMRRLEGRSDHRPVIGTYVVFV